jgi:hypothetical protein
LLPDPLLLSQIRQIWGGEGRGGEGDKRKNNEALPSGLKPRHKEASLISVLQRNKRSTSLINRL